LFNVDKNFISQLEEYYDNSKKVLKLKDNANRYKILECFNEVLELNKNQEFFFNFFFEKKKFILLNERLFSFFIYFQFILEIHQIL
jgi:hypothetical protein